VYGISLLFYIEVRVFVFLGFIKFFLVSTPQELGKCDGEHGGSWRDCPGADSPLGCYLEGEKEQEPKQEQESDDSNDDKDILN
jgi:hypothetical protein